MQPTATAVKRIGGDVLTDKNRIQGYLVRFTKQGDFDLYGDYFDTRTEFMLNSGFELKGKPILLEHGMNKTFDILPIGVFDLASVDDVGVFVEGMLYDRQDYLRMLESLNYKGISRSELEAITENAELAVKSLLSTGEAQFSSGALPQSVIRDESTGHIKRWAIVEGSVTLRPAEPNGTQVSLKHLSNIGEIMSKKQIDTGADSIRDEELEVEGGSVKGEYSERVTKLLEQTKADIVAVLEEVLSDLSQPELAQVEAVVMEELEAVAGEEIEELKADGMADDEKEEMKRIVKRIRNEQIAIAQRATKKAKASKTKAFDGMRDAVRDAYKSTPQSRTTGRTGAPAFIRERGSEAPFANMVKSALGMGSTMKAQNPNIGALGGVLIGQTLADQILPPLRAQAVTFKAGVKQTLVANTGTYVLPRMVSAPNSYRPGINDPVTESDAKFDSVTAQMRPLAAQVVIPKQLLLTSPLAVEDTLREQLITSLRLGIDAEILEGLGAVNSGSGQEIKGIFRTLADSLPANILSLGTNGAIPNFQDLQRLETQLHTGNVPVNETTGFIMNPRDRGTLRSLTTTTGEPLLHNNYGESAYEDVFGYPVYTTTSLPVNVTTGTSTNTSRIYFGTFGFGEYVMANDIEFIIDEVTLANKLQVRIIAYTYSDFIIHYPEAFAVLSGVRPLT